MAVRCRAFDADYADDDDERRSIFKRSPKISKTALSFIDDRKSCTRERSRFYVGSLQQLLLPLPELLGSPLRLIFSSPPKAWFRPIASEKLFFLSSTAFDCSGCVDVGVRMKGKSKNDLMLFSPVLPFIQTLRNQAGLDFEKLKKKKKKK